MTPATTRDSRTPDVTSIEVPGYELLKPIGRGSYGTVYLGRHQSGDWRAIKICRRDERNSRDLDRELRGLRRYEPVSRLDPGFLRILDSGENRTAGFFYCAMELADDVSGGAEWDPETYEPRTLAQELRRREALELTEVLDLGLTLGAALARLHENGLVHRDVKPANIVFVGGKPKLADLGLVVAVAEANSLVGTPGYIPPEGPGQPAGDVYAFGKVLYQALTGLEPGRFPDPPTFLRGHPDPARFQEITDVLTKACAERPTKRHDSVRQMCEELELVRGGRSVRLLREAREQRARWRRWGVIAAVFAVVVGAVGLFSHQVITHHRVQVERDVAAATRRSVRLVDDGDYGQALLPQAELVRLAEGSPEESLNRLRYATTLGQMPNLAALWTMDGPIAWCGFLPGDAEVLAASRTGSFETRRADGELVRKFEGHPELNVAAVSGDGTMIATAGLDLMLRVWSTRTGEELMAIHHGVITPTILFHPVDPVVLSIGTDGRLRWWNLLDGTLMREVVAHSNRAAGLGVSADGNLIVTGGRDNRVRFWNNAGEPLGDPLEFPSWVMAVALSENGERLMAACDDRNCYLWDVPTRRPLGVPMAHHRVVGFGAFGPAGRLVMTCGWDGYVRTWNGKTGESEGPMLRHQFAVAGGSFSSSGRRLVSGAKDGTIRVWDFAGRQCPEPITAVVGSPDDNRLVLARDGHYDLVELAGGRNAPQPLPLEPGWEPIRVSERGDRCIIYARQQSGRGTLVQLFDIQTRATIGPVHSWSGKPSWCVFVDQDDSWLLARSSRVVKLSPRGDEVWRATMSGSVAHLTVSPDGSLVAAAAETRVLVWRAADGSSFCPPLVHTKPVGRLVFDEHASRLIACTSDTSLDGSSARIWNLRAERREGPELWHRDGVKDAAWLDHDRKIATASEDGLIRMWDAQTGAPIGEEMSHRHQAMSVRPRADGLLLTASWDWTVRIWDSSTCLPVGPRFVFDQKLESARWLPDGKSFLAQVSGGESWRQTLQTIELSPTELTGMARLLAAETTTGLSPSGSAQSLSDEHQRFRAKHPALFQATEDEIVRWCHTEADLRDHESMFTEAAKLYREVLTKRPDDRLALRRLHEYASPGTVRPNRRR